MPFDYSQNKIEDAIKIQDLCSSTHIKGLINIDGGVYDNADITYPYSTKVGGYTVNVKGVHCMITKGSFHKVSQGGFNVDDFTLYDAYTELVRYQKSFNIPLKEVHPERLEFGVNFNLKWSPRFVFDRVYSDNFRMYQDLSSYSKRTIGKLLTGVNGESEKKVKFYSKLLQGVTKDNVFRFENHYSKHSILKSMGVNTLSDLFTLEVIETFAEDLLASWDKMVFLDDSLVLPSTLRKENHKRFETFSNPLKLSPVFEKGTDSFRVEKKKFNKLVKEYSVENYHNKIRLEIENKLQLMVYNYTQDPQSVQEFTDLYNDVSSTKCSGFTTIGIETIPSSFRSAS